MGIMTEQGKVSLADETELLEKLYSQLSIYESLKEDFRQLARENIEPTLVLFHFKIPVRTDCYYLSWPDWFHPDPEHSRKYKQYVHTHVNHQKEDYRILEKFEQQEDSELIELPATKGMFPWWRVKECGNPYVEGQYKIFLGTGGFKEDYKLRPKYDEYVAAIASEKIERMLYLYNYSDHHQRIRTLSDQAGQLLIEMYPFIRDKVFDRFLDFKKIGLGYDSFWLEGVIQAADLRTIPGNVYSVPIDQNLEIDYEYATKKNYRYITFDNSVDLGWHLRLHNFCSASTNFLQWLIDILKSAHAETVRAEEESQSRSITIQNELALLEPFTPPIIMPLLTDLFAVLKKKPGIETHSAFIRFHDPKLSPETVCDTKEFAPDQYPASCWPCSIWVHYENEKSHHFKSGLDPVNYHLNAYGVYWERLETQCKTVLSELGKYQFPEAEKLKDEISRIIELVVLKQNDDWWKSESLHRLDFNLWEPIEEKLVNISKNDYSPEDLFNMHRFDWIDSKTGHELKRLREEFLCKLLESNIQSFQSRPTLMPKFPLDEVDLLVYCHELWCEYGNGNRMTKHLSLQNESGNDWLLNRMASLGIRTPIESIKISKSIKPDEIQQFQLLRDTIGRKFKTTPNISSFEVASDQTRVVENRLVIEDEDVLVSKNGIMSLAKLINTKITRDQFYKLKRILPKPQVKAIGRSPDLWLYKSSKPIFEKSRSNVKWPEEFPDEAIDPVTGEFLSSTK